MKIAFTSKGKDLDSVIDPRFGRSAYFLFMEENKQEFTVMDNSDIESVEHGAGTKTSSRLIAHEPDILITGNGPGGNAAEVLARTKIRIFTGAGEMTVKEAYTAWKNNNLKEFNLT